MHASVFFLALTLAEPAMPRSISYQEVVSISDEIDAVVESEPPLFFVVDGNVDAAKTKTARLLATWSFKETRWQNIVGEPGHSFGPLQVTSVWLFLGPYTEASVLAWRPNGIRLGLRTMAHLRDLCGSVHRGLGAFAGRECGDAQGLVAWRCHLAGVDGCK